MLKKHLIPWNFATFGYQSFPKIRFSPLTLMQKMLKSTESQVSGFWLLTSVALWCLTVCLRERGKISSNKNQVNLNLTNHEPGRCFHVFSDIIDLLLCSHFQRLYKMQDCCNMDLIEWNVFNLWSDKNKNLTVECWVTVKVKLLTIIMSYLLQSIWSSYPQCYPWSVSYQQEI